MTQYIFSYAIIGLGYYLLDPITTFLKHLFLIILSLYEIKIFKIINKREYDVIKQMILYSSMTSDGECDGLIISKEFIGYKQGNSQSSMFGQMSSLYLLTTTNFLVKHDFIENNNTNKINKSNNLVINNAIIEADDNETKEEIVDDMINKNKITMWEKIGPYNGFHYFNVKLTINKNPFFKQQQIINFIKNDIENKNNISILIHGKPGSGKSMIPMFLSSQLGANISNSYDPTIPGDSLASLIGRVSPTKCKKLIVVLDEVDVLINKIHTETQIMMHKNVPTEVKNKTDWNLLLDKIDNELYQNIILILISNKPLEYFNKLDLSYMRKGRVDQIHELEGNKTD